MVVVVVVGIGLHDRWKMIIIVEVVVAVEFVVEMYRIVLVAMVAGGVMLVATIKLWW